MNAFADLPCLRGNFAPIHTETELADLPVTGRIPTALMGTLYRNGPNPQFAPRDAMYHWFLGDGMVHAFILEGGRVAYRNRWVRTHKFALERQAGRALFGSWGNPATTDPSVADDDDNGVANTNVLWHAGRLLALEEADPPVALDWHSLATLGTWNAGGRIGAMTAHPKVDPRTGELVFFRYGADGPFTATMEYGVLGPDGELAALSRFPAPYCSMVHDFLVTEHYALFPVLPITGSMERAMRGEPAWLWEPDVPGWLGVLPRDGNPQALRWFRLPACYVFHTMNAWETEGKIVADVMQYNVPNAFNPRADGGPSRLCRWTLDPGANSDTVQRQTLDPIAGEFPRFDERFATRPYRHGWWVHRASDDTPVGTHDTLVHRDLAQPQARQYRLPQGDAISEPVFVPRDAHAGEGDGWLLATVYRGATQRSDLAVFDAMAIEAGPVALAHLPHRVPFGFHGNWRPAHPAHHLPVRQTIQETV